MRVFPESICLSVCGDELRLPWMRFCVRGVSMCLCASLLTCHVGRDGANRFMYRSSVQNCKCMTFPLYLIWPCKLGMRVYMYFLIEHVMERM